MTRTINKELHTRKRIEILNTAMHLIISRGYEHTTINDIIKKLKISKGAFYHYFKSKKALLDAYIEQIKTVTETQLLAIINDPDLSGLQKLQNFFDLFDSLRLSQKKDITELGKVWFKDQNTFVRQKVDEAISVHRGGFLGKLVEQGVQEGCFANDFAEQIGEIIMSLIQSMGNRHARLLFSDMDNFSKSEKIKQIIQIHSAYMDAVERVLGAPTGSLYRTTPELVELWLKEPEGQK